MNKRQKNNQKTRTTKAKDYTDEIQSKAKKTHQENSFWHKQSQ